MHLRRLFVLVAVVLAACTPTTTPPSTFTDPTAVSTTVAPATSAPPATTSTQVEADPELLADLEGLQNIAEEVRGLEFLRPPSVAVVTQAELADRVRGLIDEDLPFDEVVVDEALLKLLGLLDPDTDLRGLYLDLYSEQVTGFYDGDTEELVVSAPEGRLSELTKVTLVHELVHALTDQHFDFHDLFVRLDEEERFDEASAFQGLIEGDATFFQFVYVQEQLDRSEQLEVALEALQQNTQVFNEAPPFLRDLLLYPYESGNSFVGELFQAGGAAAVDRAYQEPPTTTEQILHPDLYLAGEEGEVVMLPDTSLPGYQVNEESVWGELGFRVMLADAVGIGEALPASTGWGGDRYRLLWDGQEVAWALRFVGDTERDARELHDALAAYVEEAMDAGPGAQDGGGLAFSGEDYAFLQRSGDEVVFIAGSDPGAGGSLRESFQGVE
ncbi:MAG: hypothetical protein ACRD02_06765 [Acidimicrobiia bacterium]